MSSEQGPHNPSSLLRRARVLGEALRRLCCGTATTPESALRVAFHQVYAEDVVGKAPGKVNAAVKLAMRIQRLERQAEEPDYPETSRQHYRWYLEQREKLFERHPWMRSALQGGGDHHRDAAAGNDAEDYEG